MSVGEVVNGPQTQLKTVTTTEVPHPLTDWIPCIGIDDVTLTWIQRSEAGAFQSKPAVQFAAVRPDKPDDWEVLTGATWLANEGEDVYAIQLSSVVTDPGDMALVRFGVVCKGDSSADWATLQMSAGFNNPGRIVGRLRRQITVYGSGTTPVFFPIGDWIPTVGVDRIKAAIAFSNPIGTIRWHFAWRTAEFIREDPDDWQKLSSPATPPTISANEELCTGWEDPGTLSDKMWVQLGLYFDSGASNATGQVSVDAVGFTRCP